MAKRYELSDASWELIKGLVSPEQKMDRPRRDDRLVLNGIPCILCSVLPGVTCQNDLGLGRRCISVFVTGTMTVRSIICWRARTSA